MYRFKTIELHDILFYRSAAFNLDQRGISVITGLNHNARAESEVRNGVGKSMLFQMLTNLRYADSSGLARKAGQAIRYSKSSWTEWQFSHAGSDWRVRRAGNKRYTLEQDGADLKPRTATIAEQIIDRTVDLSEEEWYTYIYLDSQRRSVFQQGTGSARHAYFTQMFRLQEFDELQRQFAAAQRALAQVARDRATRLQDLEALGEPENRSALEVRLLELRADLRTLERALEAGRDAVEDRRLADRYSKDLEHSQGYNRKLLRTLETQAEAWQDYESAVAARREVEALRTEAQESIREGNQELQTNHLYTSDGVRAYNRDVRAARTQYEAARAAHDGSARDYRHAQATRLDLGRDRQEARRLARGLGPEPARTSASLRDEVNGLDAQLEQLEIARTGHCEVCGSELDAAHAQRQSRRLETRKGTLAAKINAAASWETGSRRLAELWSDHHEAQYQQSGLVPAPGPAPREPRAQEVRYLETTRTIQPEGSASEVRQQLRAQRAAQQSMARVSPIRERIARGQGVSDNNVAEQDDLQARAAAARDELYAVERSAGVATERAASRRRIAREIRRFDAQLADLPLVNTLAEAYSARGLKVDEIRRLSTTIQDNLNRFSDLLFPEQFRWEIRVDATHFDVVVTRPGGLSSDVRQLSGAESRFFALLWMIAVLPLIPADRRSNVVILDEFEANLDETLRRRLVEVYLPELLRVVEHIVFISPNEYHPQPGRRVYRVEKRDTESTIVEITV